ncbi:MAG: hypothetical protein ACRYFV_01590 [Janthinobacterium lividum]
MSYTLTDLKKLFRTHIKVKSGGPEDITRAKGMLASMDALAESVTDPTGPGAVTAAQLFPNLEAGTGIDITLTDAGKVLIACTVTATQAVSQPAAPTNGIVNDSAKEFTFKVNPAYANYTQYKERGRIGVTEPAYLSATTAYQVGDTVHVTGLAGSAKQSLAYYVGGSGNIPDGKVLSNSEAFSGSAVVVTPTPTATKATAPRFGVIDDLNNIVTLSSDYAYDQVKWGVEGQGPQTLGSNSICSPGNIAGRLYAYVVADATANRLQSDTVYSGAFSLAAVTNNAPTATLSVVGGVTSVTSGQSITLQVVAQDADAGDNIVKSEIFDNGVKIAGGEITGASGSIQTPNLTAGTHSFTAKPLDSHNAQGLSNAVVVTVSDPVSGGGAGALTFYPVDDPYWQGGTYKFAALSGFRRNTFANFQTLIPAAATQLSLKVASDVGTLGPYPGAIGVFITDASNATTFQQLNFTADGSQQIVSVPGLPAGDRKVRVMVADPARTTTNTQGQVGTVFYGFSTDAVPTLTLPPSSVPAVQMVYIGDSIEGGGGTDIAYTQAHTRLLADMIVANGGRLTVESVAGGSLNEFYGTATPDDVKAANIARIKAEGGAAPRRIYACKLGTNDVGRAASDAATFGANYAALVDALHTADPSAEIWAITPLRVATYEATLETFRVPIRNLGSSRPWLKIREGSTVLTTADLRPDGVHPVPAGHVTLAQTEYNWFFAGAGNGGTGAYINQVSATQVGHQLRISGSGSSTVEYQLDGGSWGSYAINDGTSYVGAGFVDVPYGPHTISARLVNNPTYTSSVQVVVNPILLRDSPAVRLSGTWTYGNGGAANGAYTTSAGSYYEIDTSLLPAGLQNVIGFKIIINPFADSNQQYIAIDGGTAQLATVAANGAGVYTARVLYSNTSLANGPHKLRATYQGSGQMNYLVAEVILGDPNAAATPIVTTPVANLLQNGEFDQGSGSDFTTNWVCDPTVAIVDGQMTFTNSAGIGSRLCRQQVTYQPNTTYNLEYEISELNNGGSISFLSDSGTNINFDFSLHDPSDSIGIKRKTFTTGTTNLTDVVNLVASGPATGKVKYAHITPA